MIIYFIYRAFSGILSYLPDELDSHDILLKFIYYELLQEYSTVIDIDTVAKELQEIEAFKELFNDNDNETIFLYSSPQDDQGNTMNCEVKVTTLKETNKKLNHVYHSMRGKSYNDRLVFSPHYVQEVLSLIRSLCRYGI